MCASDQDRETAVAVLRDAYVDGRLDLGELRDRAGAAYCARTWDDLDRLTADLPLWTGWPGSLGGRAPVRGAVPEARRWALAPVLPAGLAWLALAAAVFAPEAFIPLVALSLLALLAVCWAIRHADRCHQRKRSAGAGRTPRTPTEA
jgi:hypothetical protein